MMNKNKIIRLLEVTIVLIISKIIYDGVFMPIVMKPENSFSEFIQGKTGSLISWVVIAVTIGCIYDFLIKPLIIKIVKIVRKK